MSRKSLKKFLGEGAALLDDSNGADNLLAVLTELAEGVSDNLNALQATIATAVLASMVVDRASTLRGLAINVGTTGSSGTTTVQVRINGVSAGSLSVANTEADGVSKTLSLDVNVEVGDVIDLNVSAAPVAGADLTASARLRPVIAE